MCRVTGHCTVGAVLCSSYICNRCNVRHVTTDHSCLSDIFVYIYVTVSIYIQAGDTIEVLQMNPSGLWRGRCGGRVGQFKFINVELLPARRRKRSSSRSLRSDVGY